MSEQILEFPLRRVVWCSRQPSPEIGNLGECGIELALHPLHPEYSQVPAGRLRRDDGHLAGEGNGVGLVALRVSVPTQSAP